MQQMSVCPSCGRQNIVGQQFCGTCGTRLFGVGQQQTYMPQQMYSCPTCGQPVAYGVGVCGNCRTLFNWPTQQQMQPPPAYQAQQREIFYGYPQNERALQSSRPAGPMQVVSLIWGILAIIGMFVAFLPFFGWMNWANIPFSFIGLIISIVATATSKGKKGMGITGIVLCSIAIFFGSIRLIFGAGLI